MFGDVNEKQDEYLKDIHASGRHLLSLINDILDLSKVEAGRMELELAPSTCRGAIDNALTLVSERAQPPRHRARARGRPGSWARSTPTSASSSRSCSTCCPTP